MEKLLDFYRNTKNLHHAYFLVGDKKTIVPFLFDFLSNEVGLEISGNPDFFVGEFHNFDIENARSLVSLGDKKDFSGGKRIFILQTDFINLEAQNSLLKLFEEPIQGVHFFVISPQDTLLPTLRSRVQVIFEESNVFDTENILSFSIKKRLEKIKDIVDAIGDEEGTKQDAIDFINKIEKELYTMGLEKNSKQLEICEMARIALFDRGAPVKMILEHVLLNV